MLSTLYDVMWSQNLMWKSFLFHKTGKLKHLSRKAHKKKILIHLFPPVFFLYIEFISYIFDRHDMTYMIAMHKIQQTNGTSLKSNNFNIQITMEKVIQKMGDMKCHIVWHFYVREFEMFHNNCDCVTWYFFYVFFQVEKSFRFVMIFHEVNVVGDVHHTIFILQPFCAFQIAHGCFYLLSFLFITF